MASRSGAWVGSAVAAAAALVTAVLGPVTNYASATVPAWAAQTWVVWPVFGVLVAASVGLLLLGRRLDGGAPSVRLTSVDRLARTPHGSLRRQHVERIHGRETELARLTGMLRRPEGRFAVVCGAGGLGKTTVAARLASQAEDAGWAVFWLRWRSSEDLAQQLTQVAVACGLPEASLEAARAGQESLPDVIWRQLQFSRRWLIVLDNVDEPQVVGPGHEQVAHYRGWIRPHGGGLLLVTSRDTSRQAWGPRAELLRLEPLGVRDAGRVLLDAAPQAGTQEQAWELAARLGGLPLALHAAGSYLATATSRYRNFDHYRRALDAELSTLLGAQHPDASAPDVARTVVRHTWELSLDQLTEEGNRLARPLLRMMALLAQAPIPLSLLTPSLLATATGEPVTVVSVEAALAGLDRYGLLGLPEPVPGVELMQENSAQVVLHPLVREISALALKAETPELAQWHRALTDRLTEAVDDVAGAGRSGWTAARLLAPHMRLLLDHSTRETFTDARDAVVAIADVLGSAGSYALEHVLRQQVVDAQVRFLGHDHPETLTCRNDLAAALGMMGEYAQAVELHRQTLEDRIRVLGPDHRDTLWSRSGLSSALYGLGEYVRAADLDRQLLGERIRVLGPDDPDTLATRNNLALALLRIGESAQAAELHRQTLEARMRILGPDDFETQFSRNNLANALSEMGEYAQAADEHRQLVGERTRVLGPNHPDTLISRNNLAVVLYRMGEYAQAVELHRQTLEARTRISGPDHPDTLGCRNNLALALSGMREYAQAAELHRQTLEVYTRISGPDHPETLISCNNLANALSETGEYAQAVALHRQTLEARARVLGPDHPDTLGSRYNLANALSGMGEYAQAVALHRKTLEDRMRVLGAGHHHTGDSGRALDRALVASRSRRRRRDRWLRRRAATE
ncbi:FxSxx-COOH system tetratricopeptide repeat protein [Streptomyces sp. NPDC058467]|uniref:FxSxx-COOH system tetratricopeptide repeat protein n=1 Tax=Streptomyces sp. NPDC058467 TaxID=3346513 RepID=UPI003663E5F3